MAKFGDKLLDFKEVLRSNRIPVSYTGDQWFLNVEKNSVVNVHDQKTLHTWTLRYPHSFTCSVVYSDGYLYCVMDKNVLIKWSVEEDNLKNADKIKFQSSIFAVIPIDGAQPLVVFSSGQYAVITSTFTDIKPSDFVFLKENENIIWTDACVSTSNIEVVCLAKNKKSERILYNFTISKDDNSASSPLSHTIFRDKADLKTWCLNHHDLSFLSLWSDGAIYSHNIKESKDIDLMSIKDVEAKTCIDIDSIDSGHVVIARANHSGENECLLEIWDTKCGILKAEKVLKTPALSYLQVAAFSSSIFLCYNRELVSVSFHIEDPTFCAALGMSESNEYVQHSWNTHLELVQAPAVNELEPMDICSNQDSLDSIDFIVEKLTNQRSIDLMCVPESELIKLLQLAIRHEKQKSNKRKINILLNIIFSASFNDVLLLQYLKRMNVEETLIVLSWLSSFLSDTFNTPSNISERPLDMQILNWTCLIIQSHTEALLFSRDKRSQKLLKQLEKVLSVKMEQYENLDCIQSYISILEKNDILPKQCSVGKYCIENLEI